MEDLVEVLVKMCPATHVDSDERVERAEVEVFVHKDEVLGVAAVPQEVRDTAHAEVLVHLYLMQEEVLISPELKYTSIFTHFEYIYPIYYFMFYIIA